MLATRIYLQMKSLSHIQNHKIKFKKKKKKIIVDVTDATNDSKPHTKRSDEQMQKMLNEIANQLQKTSNSIVC